jgi:hypothetical protein
MGPYDRLFALIGLAGSIAVLVIAFRLEPDPRGAGTHEQLGLPPCAFLADHGVPCISCGMTTAFAAMAHGRIGLALRANPFGALLFLATLAMPVYCFLSFRRGLDPFRIVNHPRARIWLPLGGVLLLVNWGIMVLVAKSSR